MGLKPPVLQVALIAIDPAGGERFLSVVCGPGAQDYRTESGIIRLNLLAYRPEEEPALVSAIALSQAAILLVSHIDAVSLDQLRNAYRLLPSEHTAPAAILILREAGKAEFKMSCPDCSQKLWVRDVDVGRNGRCPHCKKTFVLPAQLAQLKSTLSPAESIPLVAVNEDQAGTCRDAIVALANRAREHAQALKNATRRVQIADASSTTQGGTTPKS